MKQAKEDSTEEVRFTFTTDEKSSTFAASIPDCNSMEMGYKVRHVGALAHLLLEQSYARDGYHTDCEDEDRHDRWDVSIA